MEVLALRLAEVTYPPSRPWHGRPGVVLGYVVILGGGRVALADTALGPARPEIDPYYHPVRADLASALLPRGIQPRAVSAFVCPRLHFHHCGGNPTFPGVPIYVQSAEKDTTRTKGHSIPEWFDFPGGAIRAAVGRFLPGGRHRRAIDPGTHSRTSIRTRTR